MDQQDNNALILNPTRCEVLLVAPSKPMPSAPILVCWVTKPSLLSTMLNVLGIGGHAWDLLPAKAVDEAINKAGRAFFSFETMRAFHGKLNPISGKTIFDMCVIPILLFDSENWI